MTVEGDRTKTLLDDIATYLSATRIFLSSRERTHEAGLQWHDELAARVNAARVADVEQLRMIAEVVANADSEDCIGSLDVDIPCNGYPRQWLRQAARSALIRLADNP